MESVEKKGLIDIRSLSLSPSRVHALCFRKRVRNLAGTQPRPRSEFFARLYEAVNRDEHYRHEVIKSTAIFVAPGIHVLL